jgi:hypothetical protein
MGRAELASAQEKLLDTLQVGECYKGNFLAGHWTRSVPPHFRSEETGDTGDPVPGGSAPSHSESRASSAPHRVVVQTTQGEPQLPSHRSIFEKARARGWFAAINGSSALGRYIRHLEVELVACVGGRPTFHEHLRIGRIVRMCEQHGPLCHGWFYSGPFGYTKRDDGRNLPGA